MKVLQLLYHNLSKRLFPKFPFWGNCVWVSGFFWGRNAASSFFYNLDFATLGYSPLIKILRLDILWAIKSWGTCKKLAEPKGAPWECIDVLSMFVLSKWQCVALPTCWRALIRALYWFHTFLDHTTNISSKVRTQRRVSPSGAPNEVHNCHLDKKNMENSSMHRLLSICGPFFIWLLLVMGLYGTPNMRQSDNIGDGNS